MRLEWWVRSGEIGPLLDVARWRRHASSMTPSEEIDALIAKPPDWRGERLAAKATAKK